METVDIFGVAVHRVTFEEAVRFVRTWPGSGHREPAIVSFACLYPMFQAQPNKPFHGVYEDVNLVLNDGRNLSRVARMLGTPLSEKRIAGMDFLPRLLAEAGPGGQSVYAICSGDVVAQRFRETLLTRFGLAADQIKGFFCPPFKERFESPDFSKAIAEINERRPDFVILGISSPKQERIAKMLRPELQLPCVLLCLGGAVETTAGIIPVGPQWIRDAGLESFYRVYREPGRLFRRYIISNSVFLWILAKALTRRYLMPRKRA